MTGRLVGGLGSARPGAVSTDAATNARVTPRADVRLGKSWHSKTHLIPAEVVTACGLARSRLTWEWEGDIGDVDCKRCLQRRPFPPPETNHYEAGELPRPPEQRGRGRS